MGQDQFRNIAKNSVFRKTCGSNAVDKSHNKEGEAEEQTKLDGQMNEGVLTEFIRMFRADGGNNSVREGSGPLRLRLVDKLRNADPTLALARRLRSVLRETL